MPDDKSSFYAPYDEESGSYKFNGMRDYILGLLEKGEITSEDTEFSLIPVIVSTESVQQYYSDPVIYVTGCSPYIGRPTMTELDTDHVTICFTYSRQTIQ